MANTNPDHIICRKKLSLDTHNLHPRVSSLELLQRPMIPLDIVPLTYNLEKIRRESGVFDSRGLRVASIISTASQQDIDEVHRWLNQIGKKEHITLFDQKFVQNIRQCSTLNEEDLRCMGINFNIKYMLDEIDKLKSSTKRSCSVVKEEEEEENQHVRTLSAANRLQEESPAVRSARGKHQKGLMTQEELLQVIASDAVMLAVERETYKETKTMTDSGGSTKTLRQQPINEPGSWDVMISYTQTDGKAEVEANELYHGFVKRGWTPWMDIKMEMCDTAAMNEAVVNCRAVVFVASSPSDDKDEPRASLNRPFCRKELRWAIEKGTFIQPVIAMRDKERIGFFISQAPDDLKCLGDVNFLHLDRTAPKRWEVSLDLVIDAIEKAEKMDVAGGGSSSSNNVGCGSCAVQ